MGIPDLVLSSIMMDKKSFQNFKKEINGKVIDVFTLENKEQMRVCLSNYGARILSIEMPDKYGKIRDVTLGYGRLEEHIKGLPYYGATIGRCANRIDLGQFELDGKKYQLNQNAEQNHLHGGFNSFSHQVWTVKSHTEDVLTMEYISPNMEEGYPGALSVKVSFSLSSNNELLVEMEAETDSKTIVNLTTHPFFNLEGEGVSDVLDHQLKINADAYLSMNDNFLPKQKIELSDDEVFDFRTFKRIGKDLKAAHEQLVLGRGYDHNYILKNNDEKRISASLYAPKSGIQMDIYTNQPGIQLYTGNWLDGSDIGKSGKAYHKHFAVCLEPQYFPNSPNRPDFPSIVLDKGEKYYHYTKFHFFTKSIKKES